MVTLLFGIKRMNELLFSIMAIITGNEGQKKLLQRRTIKTDVFGIDLKLDMCFSNYLQWMRNYVLFINKISRHIETFHSDTTKNPQCGP